MGSCQCTAYAADRIFQLCGVNIRSVCPGSYNGLEWSSTLSGCGYPVYNSVSEAVQNAGTLAGLLVCAGPSPSCFGGSCNHIAVCEGYDPSLDQVYISEMMGSANDCIVYLRVYRTSELSSSVRWIDISSLGFSSSGSGRGGYFKDKFGEFHWPVKPEKDARFPTSSEYQEFCDRLNEAQEEAGVENPIEFSAKQDNNVLTATRFNEYLHLMQTSDEGTLRGVDESEVEHMADVSRDDIIYAKHFLQLEDLYNHWKYGNNFLTDDSSIAGQIWNALIMKGFTPVVAAGIMGYMWGESGLDPTIIEGGNGIGFGLCQWSFERRYGDGTASSSYIWGVFPWCEARGLDPYSYSAQIEFMYWEIFNQDTTFQNYCLYGCNAAVCGGSHAGIGGVNGFLNLTDLYEVVWCFTWWFGRPRADVARIQVRYEHALEYYNRYYVNNNGSSGGGGATGNFILPLDSYQACICRPSEYYYGASDFKVSSWTPIKAVDGGTVTQAYYHYSYGNFVDIDHGNGWTSRYAHMVQTPSVSAGQGVSQGQVIGYVGSTGDSTGPHLHLEMRYNEQVICAGQVFGIYCPFSESYG